MRERNARQRASWRGVVNEGQKTNAKGRRAKMRKPEPNPIGKIMIRQRNVGVVGRRW